MKTILALLAATTALAAVLALPTLAAIRPHDARSLPAAYSATAQEAPVRLASGDDEDDDQAGTECEDDDEGGCGGAQNPAPAGTVAPPANGLFGSGAAPTVQVN